MISSCSTKNFNNYSILSGYSNVCHYDFSNNDCHIDISLYRKNPIEIYQISKLFSFEKKIGLFEAMTIIYVSLKKLKSNIDFDILDLENKKNVLKDAIKKEKISVQVIRNFLKKDYDTTVDIITKCFLDISFQNSQVEYSCVQFIKSSFNSIISIFNKNSHIDQTINDYAIFLNCLYRKIIFYSDEIMNSNGIMILFNKKNEPSKKFFKFSQQDDEYSIDFLFIDTIENVPILRDTNESKQFIKYLNMIKESLN